MCSPDCSVEYIDGDNPEIRGHKCTQVATLRIDVRTEGGVRGFDVCQSCADLLTAVDTEVGGYSMGMRVALTACKPRRATEPARLGHQCCYKKFPGGSPSDCDYYWCGVCGTLKVVYPTPDPAEYFVPSLIKAGGADETM